MSKKLYALISIYQEGGTLFASLPDLDITTQGGTVRHALTRLGEIIVSEHWNFNIGWGLGEEDDRQTDDKLDELREDGKL